MAYTVLGAWLLQELMSIGRDPVFPLAHCRPGREKGPSHLSSRLTEQTEAVKQVEPVAVGAAWHQAAMSTPCLPTLVALLPWWVPLQGHPVCQRAI